MKRFIPQCFTLLFVSSTLNLSFAQGKPLLDSIRVWTISKDSDTTNKRKTYYEYDPRGLVAQIITQIPSGESFNNDRRNVFEYNADGLRTKYEAYKYNFDGSQRISEKQVSEYDGQFRTSFHWYQRSGDTIALWRREVVFPEGTGFKKYAEIYDDESETWDTTGYTIYDQQYRPVKIYEDFSWQTNSELTILTYPDQSVSQAQSDTLYALDSLGMFRLAKVRELSYTSIGRRASIITFIPDESGGLDTSEIEQYEYLDSDPKKLVLRTRYEFIEGNMILTYVDQTIYNEDERIIHSETFFYDEDLKALVSSTRFTYDITPDSTVVLFYFKDELWNRDVRIENDYQQTLKEWAYSFVFNADMDHDYSERYYAFPAQSTSIRKLQQTLDIQIYPNPTTDRLLLNGSQSHQVHTYKIYNLEGKILDLGTYNGSDIGVFTLNPGMLLVALYDRQGRSLINKLVLKE